MSLLRRVAGTVALGGAVLLVTGAFMACGAGRTGAGGDCAPARPAGGPPHLRVPGGLGSAGGSAAVTPHQASLAGLPSPSPPPPTPSGGRLVLTAVDSRQTITVPPGTIIEVRLEPVDGVVWTVPESSDPRALPRLSASGECDNIKVATFKTEGPGEITANRPTGDAFVVFSVTVSTTS